MTAPALVFAATPEQNAALAEWAAERIEAVRGRDFGPCQAAAVIRDARIAAAVVFHDWQPGARSLQVSMAADTALWASREVLRDLFRYGFVTNGAFVLWTAIPHTSARVIRFNRGIGMRHEGVLRHRFGPKVHAAMFSMTRPEWERSKWKDVP